MSKNKESRPLSEEQISYYRSFNIFFETEEEIEKAQMMADLFLAIKKTVWGLLPERTAAYNSIINDLVIFLRQMGINNSLEMCNIFSYMMWSGMFSKDGSYGFNIKLSNVVKSLDNFGMTIIHGEGVCLNNAAMLDSLLKQAGISSVLMPNQLEVKDRMEYVPKIKKVIRKEFKNKLIMKLIGKVIKSDSGNHACEIVMFNDEYYLYDPTNFAVFPLNENLQSVVLNGTHTTSLRPATSIIFGDLSIEDIYKLKQTFLTSTSREKAQEMVKELFEKDLDFFNTNMAMFMDFSRSIGDQINIINNPENDSIKLMTFAKEFAKVKEEMGLKLERK